MFLNVPIFLHIIMAFSDVFDLAVMAFCQKRLKEYSTKGYTFTVRHAQLNDPDIALLL